MHDACEELREGYGEDEIVATSVSRDGTWQKRGFSSLNGAVAVISIETGKVVVDVEIMSRYCNACVSNEQLKESDPISMRNLRHHMTAG